MPEQLPVDPLAGAERDVAILDLVEDERARGYIAEHFERSEWSAQAAAFMRRGWLAGVNDDGREEFVAGDRDGWLGDYRRRRREEAEANRRRRAEDPRAEADHTAHAAALVRANAAEVGRRGGRGAPRLRRRA